MKISTLISLLPYLLAILISLSGWALAWKRRYNGGASTLFWVLFLGNLYVTFYVFELLSPRQATKLWWGNLRFVLTAFAPLLFLQFSLSFTQHRIKHWQFWRRLLYVWPIIFIALLFTDRWHHLIYPVGSLSFVAENQALQYDVTWIAWSLIFYSLLLGFISFALILAYYFTVRRIFRIQILLLLTGFAFLLIGAILPLADVTLLGYDISFYLLILGNLIILWGVLRGRLFQILPVARATLIEAMQDGVLVLDNQHRIVDINPVAEQYLDCRDSALVGKALQDVLPAGSAFYDQLTRPAQVLEIQVTHLDAVTYLRISKVALKNVAGDATGCLLIFSDITEQKRAQGIIEANNEELRVLNENLQQANMELKRLSQVKDEFISNISHELRSPLSNIRLNHDLLAMNPRSVPKYLEILQRETTRLTGLIENLLTISRISQQEVQPQKALFDLNQLIHEYVLDRQALAEKHDLTLREELADALPLLRADRIMIGQVVSAILTNAINYTDPGGSIEVTTQQREQDGQRWLGFSITDTGIGIPPEEQPKVFDRFYRGRAKRSDGIAGTGLGLAIVKDLVTLHEGEIELTSSGIKGDGTRFVIWLPQDG